MSSSCKQLDKKDRILKSGQLNLIVSFFRCCNFSIKHISLTSDLVNDLKSVVGLFQVFIV